MSAPRTDKLKVLIVEDEALVAMMIEDIVLDLGYDVVAIAGRLEEGMQLARDLTIDAAVVDLNLNGQRTDSIAAILQARGIPIVFATGYGAAGLAPEWSHYPVLQKPFPPGDLADALARVAKS